MWSKVSPFLDHPPAALYSELKSVNDLFEFSSKWEQASRMALGNDTCRHILQTGLLNCGLGRTGTELRNVHTPGGERWVAEAVEGGGLGQRRTGKCPSRRCSVSIQPHRREAHNFTKKEFIIF